VCRDLGFLYAIFRTPTFEHCVGDFDTVALQVVDPGLVYDASELDWSK
jgi:hypothetical protein